MTTLSNAKHGKAVNMKDNPLIEDGPILEMYNDQLFTLISTRM